MKTVQEAIEFLSHRTDPLFPRNALQILVDHPDVATAYLLDYLHAFAEDPQTFINDDNTDLLLPAVHLLAQFREIRAFQPLLSLMKKLHGEDLDRVFGDTITEGISRSLASVCDGNITAIQALAENSEVDRFVRSSAFYSLVTLACQGVMPRDELKDYCRELLEGKLQYEGEYLRVCLTEVCLMMGFLDLKDTILGCFKRWPKMSKYIRQEEMDEIFLSDEHSDERELSFHRDYITDAIAELEKWDTLYDDIANQIDEDEFGFIPSLGGYDTVETFVREFPKTGRNDPCHCGSGKKYKKCCMD